MPHKRALITVYVLPNCPSCRRIVPLLCTKLNTLDADIRILDASALRHLSIRNTPLCIFPATFINDTLAFYGDFTSEELQAALERCTSSPSTPVPSCASTNKEHL
ncbi:hypothetical protein HRbin20_00819 [bacterium HR20]|nr:hypothetical protein HRbin20_00819 [bacterium HR20]